MEIIIAFIILVIGLAVFWYFANKNDKQNESVSFEDPAMQSITPEVVVPVAEEVKPVEVEVVAPVVPVAEEVKPEVKPVVKKPAAMRASLSTKSQKPLVKPKAKSSAKVVSKKTTKTESTPAAKKAKTVSNPKNRKTK